jgi:hypothetical protein
LSSIREQPDSSSVAPEGAKFVARGSNWLQIQLKRQRIVAGSQRASCGKIISNVVVMTIEIIRLRVPYIKMLIAK